MPVKRKSNFVKMMQNRKGSNPNARPGISSRVVTGAIIRANTQAGRGMTQRLLRFFPPKQKR
jgi:hypothetical protein